MNNPIQPTNSGKWKHIEISKQHTDVDMLQKYSVVSGQINFTLGILRARRTVSVKTESVKQTVKHFFFLVLNVYYYR